MASEVSASRRRARAGLLAATLVLALVVAGGWAVTRGDLLGRPAAAPAAPAVPTGTATMTRTDVVERQPVGGTLGYDGSATVVAQAAGGAVGGASGPGGGQSQGGILTRLPAVGAVVARGQALYEVDGHAVPLWYGTRPAWRSFQPGMADGPDVRQLEANLVALGFDPDRAIKVDRHYSGATRAAVKRWQRRAGRSRTGAISLGEVVFLPGPIRVAGVTATVGAPVQPGVPIFAATSTRPVVTVALNPAMQQLVRRGNRVLVVLPDGRSAPGTVTAVGRAAVVPGGGSGPAGGQGDSGGGDQSGPPTIPVTIGLVDPRAARGLDQAPVQVAITTEEHREIGRAHV